MPDAPTKKQRILLITLGFLLLVLSIGLSIYSIYFLVHNLGQVLGPDGNAEKPATKFNTEALQEIDKILQGRKPGSQAISTATSTQ